MKHHFSIAAFLFAISPSLHAADPVVGTELTREQATKIVSYDLDKLEDKAPMLSGEIVRLKFNYRSTHVTKKPDGSMDGELLLWKYPTGAVGSTYKSGSLLVTVPTEGVEWFMKQPSIEARATLLIYARLPEGKGRRAVLLGREIKTDVKGPRIVW